MTIFIIIYSALLVAAGNGTIPTSNIDDDDEQKPEDDIETLEVIKEAQRTYEHRRRTYGDIFAQDSESTSDEIDGDQSKKDSTSSLDTDSDAPISTDSDSPYGSDSESSSSYDEYYAAREIPKKKIHRHHKGPIKSYFEERIGNWPKYRYKKYKRRHMKKRGIQINYGNVHTKEIKRSLKDEKRGRKKEENQPINVTKMIEDVPKQTAFLSLDARHPITPIELDKTSVSSFKSIENERSNPRSPSTFRRMKERIKNSFIKKYKGSTKQNVELLATYSDAASHTSGGDEIRKSNRSLDKV